MSTITVQYLHGKTNCKLKITIDKFRDGYVQVKQLQLWLKVEHHATSELRQMNSQMAVVNSYSQFVRGEATFPGDQCDVFQCQPSLTTSDLHCLPSCLEPAEENKPYNKHRQLAVHKAAGQYVRLAKLYFSNKAN